MSNGFRRHAFRWCSIFLGLFAHNQTYAQTSTVADCRSEIEKIDRQDKSGPLSIYQLPDDKFLIEIKSDTFDTDFIYSNYVDRGIAPFVGRYAEPKLITFRLNGTKIDVVENDSVRFFADEGPLSRTRTLTMSDSVIASLKLHTCQPGDTYFAYVDQSVLTSLSSEFLSGFRGTSQSTAEIKDWKSFSDNINFVSEHRMTSSRRSSYRSPGAIFSVQIRHIFIKRPQEAFRSRLQDSRVGYFTVSRKNLADIDQALSDVYINKWRLEKIDPEKPVSKPVKPIVFWIENTTPDKFRPYIRDGVLAWNEAFLAAGFSDAIEVYEQPADADWEAGDISKNVIRWQVAYNERSNFGVAPSVHDPVTGEILGADILLNYAGIGDYLDDWARLSEADSFSPSAPLVSLGDERETNTPRLDQTKVSNTGLPKPDERFLHIEGSYILASLVDANERGEKSRIRDTNFNKITSPSAEDPQPLLVSTTEVNEAQETSTGSVAQTLGLAERLVKEVITELTMHEVGHALGLSHNFSGSHWRSMDEIFDKEKTDGVVSSSVMDYLPINFSPLGMEQGDFTNTRLGPYDIWAIEFGYTPNVEDGQREALLERAASPEYSFSPIEFGANPNALLYDLTSTPVDYAKSRIKFATEVSQLASREDVFDDQRQYLSLYQELQYQISQGIDTIAAQVSPSLNPNSMAGQKKAIQTLDQLLFSTNTASISEELVEKLGNNRYFAFASQLGIKRSVLTSMMYDQALLFRHYSNNEYEPTELLFDLKNAVFGADLYLLGHPNQERRDQQILFAHFLAALVNDNMGGETARNRRYMFDQSIVSASALPIRNSLRRELWLPIPWAPREVRAHRQQLKSILQ